MVHFFANLIPFICLLWSLSLVLFYNTLYIEYFDSYYEVSDIGPAIAILVIVAFLLIMPIRTCIGKCMVEEASLANITYKEAAKSFVTDYDKENPITTK